MAAFMVPIFIVGAAVVLFTVFYLRGAFGPRRVEGIDRLLTQGKPAAAIQAAKRLLSRDPKNVDAHFLLGKAYMADEKPELALMELRAVNQIGHFDGYCTERAFRKIAAELYSRFNQVEEALKEYVLLAKLEPSEAGHLYRIGDLFERKANAKQAFVYFAKTLKLDGRHSMARYRLGVLYYRAKKLMESRDQLTAALKIDQENHHAHYYLGKVLKELGDSSSALRCFEKAQKLPDLRVRSLVERGGCYMKLQDYERGISELSRAVKLSDADGAPENLYARYFLAVCYEKRRMLDKAVEQWEAIAARKPGFRDVSQKLEEYQALRHDDRLKDYLTADQEAFQRICVSVVESLGMSARDVSSLSEGCQIIALETESRWRNVRQRPRLCWFTRIAEPVNETTVRKLTERMKRQNINLGMLAASSPFTRTAAAFAESRPVRLVDKESLQEIMKQGAPE